MATTTAEKTATPKGEKHRFGAETSKVLHLMIHALYTNRDIFLRELVSNASDALDKLRFEARTDDSLMKDAPDLAIHLSIDEKKRTLTIVDNGIGMNHDELIENLGTIARSGTQEFASRLTGDVSKDVNLIGQFGVGFYSAFMVADRVEVKTRRAGEEQGWVWLSDGMGEFEIEPSRKPLPRGTRITLHLKKEDSVYLDSFRLEHIIKTYSDHIPFPIYVEETGDEEATPRQLNKGSALWMRPKTEVSEEQYKEFYKQVSHLPDSPWLTLHNHLEGTVSYRYLLYVPSMRPFDLFHPDRMRRVKLYVKKVFIAEEGVELIPSWLRFLRGVVDSEDLPLNISRESLQHNALLEKIKKSLTKKILSELKKKGKDAEAYATFWKNFGAVVKEGLCEFDTEKDTLLEICRFQSSQSHGTWMDLDGYIERMKDGQDAIYYLTGDDAEAMQNNPQLEGFNQRGYEVLFFTDQVDSFWTNVVHEYKGKKLLSVTKAKLTSDTAPKDDKDKTDAEIAQENAVEKLMTELKTLFGQEVKNVRTTEKLTQTPACLALDEGDMDIRMERFLIENNQLPGSAAKILEINARHPVVQHLCDMASKPDQAEDFRDVAYLLLDQARIIEGEDLKDPGSFARRLSKYLERGLKAA